MKIVLSIFVFSFFCGRNQAQILKNTIWIQVKAEKKDGSRIVDYENSEDRVIKYDFREDEVMISDGNLYIGKMNYLVHNRILEIGKFVRFTIDTLDDKKLVLTQVSNENLGDDKITRLTFINRSYIFNYLKENNLIKIIQDSIVEYSDKGSPAYYGTSLSFEDKLSISMDERILAGTFIITASGNVQNVSIEGEKGFSRKDTSFIKEAIRKTSGSWMIAYTPAHFQYKMNFILKTTYFKPVMIVNLSFVNLTIAQRARLKNPGLAKLIDANKYYKQGVELLEGDKIDEAVSVFLKCLNIDSLYIDAYYDLAYCYGKLNQKEKMCEVLKKLKDFGQKTGSDLYDSTCQ